VGDEQDRHVVALTDAEDQVLEVAAGLRVDGGKRLVHEQDLRLVGEEASRHVDVEQLCLSPQCGFSSTVEGNALTLEQQADKLRLIVETAEEVWG